VSGMTNPLAVFTACLGLLLLACAPADGNPAGSLPPGSDPDLGPGASLHGRRPFPDDNPWNMTVDQAPVAANSDILIASIGVGTALHPDFGADYNGGPFGIPYVVVDHQTGGVAVTFDYADESDPGPYPIPPGAPIEGGSNASGDRHVLVVDRESWKLYELFSAYPPGAGGRPGPAPSSISTATHSDPLAGPRPTLRGYQSFPAWCATMRWWSRGRFSTRSASPHDSLAGPTSVQRATTPAATPVPAGRPWASAFG